MHRWSLWGVEFVKDRTSSTNYFDIRSPECLAPLQKS
jgi:hypothetical protein